MKIYVMRHGITVWNEKCIIQGRRNNRLSKNGIELVEKAALDFKDVQIDLIISSPLMRTVQTAKIMNKYHNVEIVKDYDITEINQGIFTGRSKLSLTPDEKKLKQERAKSAGIESYKECFERCKRFVKNIKSKYKFENILIVTHEHNATFIESLINKKQIDFQNLEHFKQAEIKDLNF